MVGVAAGAVVFAVVVWWRSKKKGEQGKSDNSVYKCTRKCMGYSLVTELAYTRKMEGVTNCVTVYIHHCIQYKIVTLNNNIWEY